MHSRPASRWVVLYASLAWLVCNCSGEPLDRVADTLVSQFAKSDIVALGEWHWTREDSDLRIRVVRHPEFFRRVRYIVTECANSLHQEVLNRYVAGGRVPQVRVAKSVARRNEPRRL